MIKQYNTIKYNVQDSRLSHFKTSKPLIKISDVVLLQHILAVCIGAVPAEGLETENSAASNTGLVMWTGLSGSCWVT